jgi:hypothetical protein
LEIIDKLTVRQVLYSFSREPETLSSFNRASGGTTNELSADEKRAKRSEAMKKSWAARRKNA